MRFPSIYLTHEEACHNPGFAETNQNLSPGQDHSQSKSARSNSWAECRDKKGPASTRGGNLSLDISFYRTFPICGVGSNGRCNTIWYISVFKGGVYETRETVWAFRGAEVRRVATLESGADAA